MSAKSPKLDLPNGRFLRLLQKDDITQDYVDALNDKDRVQYMTSLKEKTSFEDAVQYVNENNKNKEAILFGIFENDNLLGTSRLHDIDSANKTAWMGIFIFKNDPDKKGLGTSVITKIVNFAFDDLNLETVRAGIFVENKASAGAFSKAGFSVYEQSVYNDKEYQKWIKSRPDVQ